MPSRLLPARVDNTYHGHPIAAWVFAGITLVTLGRSLVHVFSPDGGARSIATIPLDRMTAGGAEGVIFVFALWGWSQLLLGLVFASVLLRYRALIPAMYVVIGLEYVGRFLIGQWKGIPTLETPPGATANVVFPFVAVAMLWLSLRGSRDAG